MAEPLLESLRLLGCKQGLHVVVLEPSAHLGGMVTGGLSATDLGYFQIIGGYARAFYLRAAAHYVSQGPGFTARIGSP